MLYIYVDSQPSFLLCKLSIDMVFRFNLRPSSFGIIESFLLIISLMDKLSAFVFHISCINHHVTFRLKLHVYNWLGCLINFMMCDLMFMITFVRYFP